MPASVLNHSGYIVDDTMVYTGTLGLSYASHGRAEVVALIAVTSMIIIPT